MAGAGADIGAVLRAREPVDQDYQRPLTPHPYPLAMRPMEACDQPVAVGHGKLETLRRIIRQRGLSLQDVVAQGLEIATPPGHAAAKAREYQGRASHPRTGSICSGVISGGQWPMPGNSTSSAFAAMARAVSARSRSDSAPRSSRTGQVTAFHRAVRSTSTGG